RTPLGGLALERAEDGNDEVAFGQFALDELAGVAHAAELGRRPAGRPAELEHERLAPLARRQPPLERLQGPLADFHLLLAALRAFSVEGESVRETAIVLFRAGGAMRHGGAGRLLATGHRLVGRR